MWENFKQQCFNMVTEPDNKTICPARVAGLIAMLEWLVIVPLNYFQHGVFDMMLFGAGFGALITGVGVALAVKKDSPIQKEV